MEEEGESGSEGVGDVEDSDNESAVDDGEGDSSPPWLNGEGTGVCCC